MKMTDEPEDDKKTTAQKALVVGYTLIAWPSKKGEETYKCHGTPASIKKLAGEDDEFEQSGFKFTAYCKAFCWLKHDLCLGGNIGWSNCSLCFLRIMSQNLRNRNNQFY